MRLYQESVPPYVESDVLRDVRDRQQRAMALETARGGPRAAELAELERRAELTADRMLAISQFAVNEARAMRPSEAACFDEATLELGKIKREIDRLIGVWR